MTAVTESTHGKDRRDVDQVALRLSRSYQDALRVGDVAAAGEIAEEVLRGGVSVAYLYQRVIAPAMWRIGDLWEAGAISIADEHLATALTQQVMAAIYGPNLGKKALPGRIMLAGVEDEQHSLGLRMAADVVELAGYETIYLGANLPTEDLLREVAAWAPDLLALSATMPGCVPALDRVISAAHLAYPRLPVVFGGQGARPREDGSGIFVESLEVLLEVVAKGLDLVPPGSSSVPAPVRMPVTPPPAGRLVEQAGVQSDESARGDGSLEQDLSQIAAGTADLARSLARQANTFKGLAYTDTLTGLPNRRAFEDLAAELVDSSEAKPVAVLMLDLDGFKAVNDQQGHAAGDQVLAMAARALTASLRDGDYVARLGGDEFAVLLPRTALEEAKAVADRLREGVEQVGSKDSVTASIGLAMLDGDVRRAMSRADIALYDAKDAGRNTVRSPTP